MDVIATDIPDVKIVAPKVFPDERGHFLETYQRQRYDAAGISRAFVQDNLSVSVRGTLRGLHFQIRRPQAKLIHVISGAIYDVAVDLRPDSPTFKKWVGITLTGEDHRQMFIPEGFAHGFCVTSEEAFFSYKCTDYYAPEDEGGLHWSDPDIGVRWPLDAPIISGKDAGLPMLSQLAPAQLPGGAQGI